MPDILKAEWGSMDIEEAARRLVVLYRDVIYGCEGGFVGAYRVKEWVDLCAAIKEPTETVIHK